MSHFIFKGFNAGSELSRKAQKVFDQIMDRAPYGATAIAILENDGERFRCSMSVYSTHGPFTASVVDLSAEGALERIERTLVRKLLNWSKRRDHSLFQSGFGFGMDWNSLLTS